MGKIRVIRSEELAAGPPTPGMTRREAFSNEELWMGDVHAEAGSLSGWHHHGEHTTIGRVVKGTIHFEFGADGEEAVQVDEGDYFVVPPHTVHREGNPSANDGPVVLVRRGTGPTVVNVEGRQ